MVNDIAVQEFVKAIKETPQDTNRTYNATVSHVDDEGVVWVNIHGSEKETPTASTSTEVQRGDAVTVQWRNNKLYIGGNYSNPSAGVVRVASVEQNAEDARLAAEAAEYNARLAQRLAEQNAITMANTVIEINNDIADLQNQIDGNITTWFYDYQPTTSNAPASTWTTVDEKNNHLGDLFYDTSTGYAYRWMSDGASTPTFSWSRITDTDVTTALATALAAQDTADHKRRVFITTPTVPYDVGDLWCEGTTGDILTCTHARTETQSYTSSDWAKLNKYTDDTRADEAYTLANTAKVSADGKNKIYRQATQPSDGTYVVGDIWFDTSHSNKIYRYSGSAWVAVTLGDDALDSLSANKLTAGTIDASIITVSNLDAGNITTGNLAADQMKVYSISAINSNTGTVKIAASKVEIDGTATFNAIKSSADAAYDAKGAASDVQTALQTEIDAKKSTWNLMSTSASGATYQAILGYAESTTTFTIDNSASGFDKATDVQVGDTVRLKYKATDMGSGGTYVYIIGKATQVPPTVADNKITLAGRGLDTTVIDGGHILTGTIDANKVNVSNLTVGSAQSGWGNVLNDNIEVGGKNLLRNTYTVIPTLNIFPRASFTISGYTYNVDVAEWGAKNATRLSGSGCTDTLPLIIGGALDRLTTASVLGLANQWYTFSMYVKNNHATNDFILESNWSSPRVTETVAAGESKRVVLTAKANGSLNLQINLKTATAGAEVNVTLWHPQLEMGTKATAWSIASEDQQGASGRNLLRGTSECNIIYSACNWNNAAFYRSNTSTSDITEIKPNYDLSTDSLTSPVSGVSKGFKIVPDTINTVRGFAQDAVPLSVGWYTLSAWVKGASGDSIRPQVFNISDSTKSYGIAKTIPLTSSDWTFVSWTTYNPIAASRAAGYFYGVVGTIGHAVYVVGMKLEQGCVPTAWTPAPEDNDTALYDGRNLIAGSADDTAAYTAYIGPDYNFIEPLKADTCVYITANVTVVGGIKSIGFYHSGGTHSFQNRNAYWRGDITAPAWISVAEGTQTISFPATVTSGMAEQTGGLGYGFLRIYKSSNATGGASGLTGSVKINWVKIEKGFRPSDWNDSVASYITAIDKSGIKVHASNNIDSNYAKIDATGMEVYKGGNKVAKFGQTIELSDGTRTLYEVKPLSGAAKVTRLYNLVYYDGYKEAEPFTEIVHLGRTVSSWSSIVLTYDINSTVYTKTYSSFPISDESEKFTLDISYADSSNARVNVGINLNSDDNHKLLTSETLTIVSLVFTYNTTQTAIESTLGAYADKTQSAAFRVGNGISTNAESNSFSLDWAGNGYFNGDVYANCDANSSGGVSLGTVQYIPSAFNADTPEYHMDIGVFRIGMVVMLDMTFFRNKSITAGGNVFNLDISRSEIPMPQTGVATGMAFYNNSTSSRALGIVLGDTDGTGPRIRVYNNGTNAVTISSTQEVHCTMTYICDTFTASQWSTI